MSIVAPPFEEPCVAPCADCAGLRKQMEYMQLALRLQDARLNLIHGMRPAQIMRVDRDFEKVLNGWLPRNDRG